MGHVLMEKLRKEFIERRKGPRKVNSHPDTRKGQRLLVLNDVDLEFQDGELVCILGPSGCGKTTLVRIIAGFDTATSGTLLIDGKGVNGPSSDNIFVFQHNGLLPWLTVWENVQLGLRHMKDKEEMATKIEEYLDVVNLSGFGEHYPHQLSGGMQRRAELARALVVNPEILFMDEPFAGLDFLTRLKMREEVINMHEFFHKTIIFITHDIEEALVMADRVVVFSDRPAAVTMNLTLEAHPHPRDFHRDSELENIRRRVYMELGVHYAL
jgi:ABC-type nitrate/sulfonate/bicarbonate transport system ATPase subunit